MNYEILCAKVIAIARLTGNFIRKESMNFDATAIEFKGLNDLVSYVDKNAEKQLVRNLTKLLPGAGFITEEKTVDRKGSTYNWIIDPLDGTTNFIHGIPTYAISIALYEEAKPVIGVVYEINRGEMFYTFKGGQAFLNNKPIAVSSRTRLADCLLATGFPYYQFDKQLQYMELLAEMMRSCHGLRRIGAAAVDLAYVACGRFDAFFEYNLNSWDVAAGAYLVQQAGGHILNFEGGDEFIEKREILASNALLDEELLLLMQKHFK
ncbi:inositol monophosphatase family protein [Pedobacter heparinus]|uniref:Inositol-1-monophosphatase n=1 Tax=Pedobacter heparinus (strain ATCC 13125 / DSM 2366 / CIP 104194 / JCM 7457 / NBRC 12017 / NCIMB 9290 / NRRL B-14731 / HIM 762-3) TaxID=485917 RepID=C6Y1Z1_PEDHD|nr:inositol monophosphatase family protein [Pedobacter heparinus]ACU05133.1 inositol monophosphatase [Pedobacter heparinus DSM 2366]